MFFSGLIQIAIRYCEIQDFAFSLCIIQEDDVTQPFNDSGCLLADEDLFETGLEEDSNSPLEDEESLESIRAAVKNKVKKHKASKR